MGPRADRRGEWRVGTKLIVLTVPLIAAASLIAAFGEYSRNQAGLKQKLATRAKSLAHQIMADRQYYASVVVPRVAQLGGTMGPDYAQVHGRFPLPATFVREVSEAVARTPNGYTANLISPWPINKDKGIKDHFERQGFDYLTANTGGQFMRTDTIEGRTVLRVLMADLASAQSCVSCHNAHASSPRHDFKLNDLMGGLEIVMPMDQYLQESRKDLIITLAGGTAMCLLVVGIVAFGTNRAVTRPLAGLAQRMGSVAATAGGVLDLPGGSTRDNEVTALTAQFEAMQAVIKQQQDELLDANTHLEQRVAERTEELRQTTAEKERISSELRIASEIQRSILPRTFPPFPEREDFAIYAETIPAREMGGDFYDFFLIDADHLGFVIADVSDKGVPAAIFMAVSRSLIKATARKGVTPGDCLQHVNSLLCPDNDSSMFVTVFYGVLNTRTGEVAFSNAGHNLPYLLRSTGDVEVVRGTGGMALGVMDGQRFETKRTTLRSGDTLFLYTDGITEAMDPDSRPFTDERLRSMLQGADSFPPKELLQRAITEVRRFTQGATQSDDITALALQYHGGAPNAEDMMEDRLSVSLTNNRSEIERVGELVEAFGARHDLPPPVVFAVNLALEETLMNVISYGYGDNAEHQIQVRLALDQGEVRAEVEDDGAPFNPLEAPVPDVSRPIETRPVGGLGIHLTRQVMDGLEYRRQGNKNLLIMRKRVGA
jgi:serine phosphatase RsbU (regulator of sigma subunit)/anti-sigma regulatory factor (Ser/Thr protein kinase)